MRGRHPAHLDLVLPFLSLSLSLRPSSSLSSLSAPLYPPPPPNLLFFYTGDKTAQKLTVLSITP